MSAPPARRDLRVLPYPGGRMFAFTIVDDTDGQTLETARPVYDELAALGLKTTKTVWVTRPATEATRDCDRGDTLERPEYVAWLRALRQQGFEIALHNVSSQSTPRALIIAGLERFREVFGVYPAINIHHEKNQENLYFDVAQRTDRLPSPYLSSLFRALHAFRRRLHNSAPQPSGCSGEKTGSDYFWGDVCKEKIRYVRTNVFVNDLNTQKICPVMPVSFPDTPYVNYWFYSSEGQDAAHFNRMLSDRNIHRLREENGCSFLYTHFGKGFVEQRNGGWELNAVTRERLRRIAASEDGWFAPASVILDRLLAFQKIELHSVPGGLTLHNRNAFDIESITFLARPGVGYYRDDGAAFIADAEGRFVLPVLRAGEAVVIRNPDLTRAGRRWNGPSPAPLWSDIKHIGEAVAARLASLWPRTHAGPR